MWSTRQATRADLPALTELCLASVGPDDYVPAFLERFLRDSVTLIAADADRVVGMMVYDDIPDGGAWLHAARTHPDHRRQGVAKALNAACENLARARGRSCLRLWAEARNTASVAASKAAGFEERARFTRMRIAAAPSASGPSPEPVDLARDWPAIESSPLLKAAAGYVFHDFYFLPLTRRNAALLVREGALHRFGGSIVAVSEDFEDAWGKDLQIQLVAGDVPTILRAAPAIARGSGADRVESFLPHRPELLEAARESGYGFMEWGQEAVLFEKRLL